MLRKVSGEYGWPKFGHNAELISLVHHCKLREGIREDGPGEPHATNIINCMKQLYAVASWRIPEDFLTYSHFRRMVCTKVDWTSSPGYPYLLRATNNRQFFRLGDDNVIDENRLQEIWQIVQSRISGASPDPIRLFVKPEPHTGKKIREERYRLISSVSIIDQLIDHMLFSEFNDKLIENHYQIPSKPGWSPLMGGWRAMPEEKWVATDASSWDWTVQPWILEALLRFRSEMCENLSEQWVQLATRRYVELFGNPVFVTSGGLLLKQSKPGVMKSGCVNTISDNSLAQVLLHVRICNQLEIPIEAIFSMGDDRLQKPLQRQDEYMSTLSQFCRLKSVVYKTEFAGFLFEGRRVTPVHRGKHAYNLLHMKPEVVCQMADSYLLNYHRSNYRNWFEQLFTLMGVEYSSRAMRDLIFDGV